MNLSDFDYDLPHSLIAQYPIEPRDSAKLLVLHRSSGRIEHRIFHDVIDYLTPADVLVMNTTRVIPARLHAFKESTGGKVEILLLRQLTERRWQALIGGKNVNPGLVLRFAGSPITATVIANLGEAERLIEFSQEVNALLVELGEMPLPPYIQASLNDPERYQTVYSQQEGSVAAPTAGLHFTQDLLERIRKKGVSIATCVLHVGLDTFQPVKSETIAGHRMHTERAYLTTENAVIINHARQSGGRIIAVGTTTARTLETSAVLKAGGTPAQAINAPESDHPQPVMPIEHETDLFIYPGYQWRAVDCMITNFHLPKSTLLMMLSALVGREKLLAAYEVAKQNQYRFFSFGDAMLIL
jgi:S-adenosylmethionine:tRNA ribosyltransferase-isomerase